MLIYLVYLYGDDLQVPLIVGVAPVKKKRGNSFQAKYYAS